MKNKIIHILTPNFVKRYFIDCGYAEYRKVNAMQIESTKKYFDRKQEEIIRTKNSLETPYRCPKCGLYKVIVQKKNIVKQQEIDYQFFNKGEKQ